MKIICTHLPQIYRPTTLVSVHWRPVLCHKNLRGERGSGVPWFPAALDSQPVPAVHKTPQERTCSSSLSVDLWFRDFSWFPFLFFFFLAQKDPVVRCWISSGWEMHVLFNQHSAGPQNTGMLLSSKQMCAVAPRSWWVRLGLLIQADLRNTLVSEQFLIFQFCFTGEWHHNYIQIAPYGWKIRILIHDQHKYESRYN